MQRSMAISEELLHALESLLVKEFRNCQALDRLTREERTALTHGKAADLLAITGRKQALLDRLIQLESSKEALFLSLAQAFGDPTLADQPQHLLQRLSREQAEQTAQLDQLQDGILALTARVREQTRSNRALVHRALQRASALQNYLISLCNLPSPAGTASSETWNSEATLPAVLAAAVEARRALDGSDRASLRAAAHSLQQALDNLNTFLKHNAAGQEIVGGDKPPFPLESLRRAEKVRPQPDNPAESDDLVEIIADLYRQETAYQAVLQISNLMLANI